MKLLIVVFSIIVYIFFCLVFPYALLIVPAIAWWLWVHRNLRLQIDSYSSKKEAPEGVLFSLEEESKPIVYMKNNMNGVAIISANVKVAGTKRTKRNIARFLSGQNQTIKIVPEPKNQFDKNALMVMGYYQHKNKENELLLGYIPRAMIAELVLIYPNVELFAYINKIFLPVGNLVADIRLTLAVSKDKYVRKLVTLLSAKYYMDYVESKQYEDFKEFEREEREEREREELQEQDEDEGEIIWSSDDDPETKRAKRAANVDGRYYTEHVNKIKMLMKENRFDEAEKLLIKCVEATKREAKVTGLLNIPPWYEEQLMLLREKRARLSSK